jgi:hypothetical protein
MSSRRGLYVLTLVLVAVNCACSFAGAEPEVFQTFDGKGRISLRAAGVLELVTSPRETLEGVYSWESDQSLRATVTVLGTKVVARFERSDAGLKAVGRAQLFAAEYLNKEGLAAANEPNALLARMRGISDRDLAFSRLTAADEIPEPVGGELLKLLGSKDKWLSARAAIVLASHKDDTTVCNLVLARTLFLEHGGGGWDDFARSLGPTPKQAATKAELITMLADGPEGIRVGTAAILYVTCGLPSNDKAGQGSIPPAVIKALYKGSRDALAAFSQLTRFRESSKLAAGVIKVTEILAKNAQSSVKLSLKTTKGSSRSRLYVRAARNPPAATGRLSYRRRHVSDRVQLASAARR